MESLFRYELIKEWIPFIFNGLWVTLLIAGVAAIFGVLIGIILVISYKHKSTTWLAKAYIDIFRGTPLLLQLSIIYYAVPQITERLFNDVMGFDIDIRIAALTAAFATFSLNSGAYISEIIRSGINSVDPGEIEAAKALGISKFHTFKDITLPIAFRNSFPALMNEFITLVKETSVVSLIGIQDLMRRQQLATSATYTYFEPLIVVGVIYYVVIKILTIISRKIEVKLAHDKR